MQDESRVETAKRFSKIWWKSRADSGKSQEFMAMGLGVSKKTIQNWEKGISSPSLFQGFEWFKLLGLNPTPYFYAFLYPDLMDGVSPGDDDEKIESALFQLIQSLTMKEKRELFFLMMGEHGSSWYSLLQMMTAHCHTTMQSRALVARIVCENFEMDKERNMLVCPNHIMPDIVTLERSVNLGKNAAMKNENGYI